MNSTGYKVVQCNPQVVGNVINHMGWAEGELPFPGGAGVALLQQLLPQWRTEGGVVFGEDVSVQARIWGQRLFCLLGKSSLKLGWI